MTDSKGKERSQKKRGGKNRVMIFLTLLILFLITGSYLVVHFRLGLDVLPIADLSENLSARTNSVRTNPGPMVDISEFLVNIISEDNSHYLKTSMVLELSDSGSQKELEVRMPQARDAILMLISNKTFDELYDIHGKKQLKAEIMLTVNALLSRGEVRAVYFTDFIVQ